MSLTKTLDTIITSSFYSLLFLVPLILTPFNFELFEFNKMLLVYFFTIIITGCWLVKMVLERKIQIPRTPLDYPLLAFFLSQLISTVFSIHSYTSIWGYYSRSHGGLASTIAYLLLFYTFVAHFDKKRTLKAIYFLLASGFLVASYGILEHFGIDKDYWVQDVQNRVFSTMGQPNWLAAWLAALMPIPWAFALISNIKYKKSKIHIKNKQSLISRKLEMQKILNFALYICYLIFYICFLFTRSRSGLIGFLVGLLTFFTLFFFSKKPSLKKNIRSYLQFIILIFGLTLVASLLVGTEFTPSLEKILKKFSKKPAVEKPTQTAPTPIYAPEISGSWEIRKVVWPGAIAVWSDNAKTILLGDGCETFGYSYYNHRPAAHNLLSEWDFLYNKAHNEYLNFLANSGILGLGSYLAVIGVFVAWNIKRIRNQESGIRNYSLQFTDYGLLAGFASILVTNFFGFSVVAVGLLFFLFPAFSFVLAEQRKKFYQISLGFATRDTRHVTRYLLVASIFLVTCYLLLVTVSLWFADYYYAQGKGLSDTGFALKAIVPLKKAISLNKKQADFHAELAEAAALVAISLPPEATPSAETTAWQQLAIQETETALRLNPVHLNILKSQAKIYVWLAQIDVSLLVKAYETLNQAIKLAPTEPRIRYNQALILNQLGGIEEATGMLEQAVKLKPNYHEAHFALALLYKETGRIEEAKKELVFILEKIDPKDEAAQKELELLEGSNPQ